MARIRSIKPDFPHSESMGRVSRDARLTFILLWTVADDEGRLRANSRMLASLLFPYDTDAPRAIDKWLAELSKENCIIRYKVDGNHYIEICNWLRHQKIDKPSKSKIHPFAKGIEDSPILREGSSLDGKGVEGKGKEGRGEESGGGGLSELVSEWNSTPGVSKAIKLTDKRTAAAKARLADPDWNWRAALAKFPLKCFAAEPDGWVPDFDFFLRPDTVTNILEGKYDWIKAGSKPPQEPKPTCIGGLNDAT